MSRNALQALPLCAARGGWMAQLGEPAAKAQARAAALAGRVAQPGLVLARTLALALAAASTSAAGVTTATATAATMPADSSLQRVTVQHPGLDEDDLRRLASLPITVVGRDALDSYGDTSVLDVLQRLPGVSIDTQRPVLRGLGNGYTLVLLNGSRLPTGFSLAALAPGDIERVEIVRGATAEHGGVSGSINLVLRTVPRLRLRELRATLGHRAHGPEASLSVSWGDRIGPWGFELPLTLARSSDASHQQQLVVTRAPSGLVSRQQTVGDEHWQRDSLTLTPTLSWKPSARDEWQLQWVAQASTTHRASLRGTEALEGPVPGSVRDQSGAREQPQAMRASLQWVHKWPQGQRLELKASGQGGQSPKRSESQGLSPAGVATAQTVSLYRRDESQRSLGARLSWPWGESHTLSLGLDLDDRRRSEVSRSFSAGNEQLAGSFGLPSTERNHRFVAFAEDSWAPAARWQARLGLRAEQVQLHSTGSAGLVDHDYAQLSPVLHLRHALDASGRNLLRVNLARSMRVPGSSLLLPTFSLNGSYGSGQPNTPIAADSAGNPDLAPEKATGFDLAWEQHVAKDGVLSVGLFYREISNLIRRNIALETVAEAAVPRWVSRPTNLGKAYSSGLELEFKGRGAPWPGAAWAWWPAQLRWRSALSLYRSALEQLDDPDARIEGQPPWRASLGFDHTLSGQLSLGSSLSLSPAFATRQTDRTHVWRGAARRLDAYLLWRVDPKLQWRLTATNLLAADDLSSSRIDDLDGFSAGSDTQRQTRTALGANLQWRF